MTTIDAVGKLALELHYLAGNIENRTGALARHVNRTVRGTGRSAPHLPGELRELASEAGVKSRIVLFATGLTQAVAYHRVDLVRDVPPLRPDDPRRDLFETAETVLRTLEAAGAEAVRLVIDHGLSAGASLYASWLSERLRELASVAASAETFLRNHQPSA